MENLLLSPIPLDLLKSEISEIVKRELERHFSLQLPKEEVELITRKEAAKMLSISLPTLNEWTKEGKVIGYRISSRVRYKRSEIQAAVIQVQTSKHQRRIA